MNIFTNPIKWIKNKLTPPTVVAENRSFSPTTSAASVNTQMAGEYIKYHANGIISEKGFYKNGLPDGLYATYYDNGSLKECFMYQNGMRHGSCLSYYKSGQLKSQTIYNKGYIAGEYISYHENGQINEKYTSYNGQKQGDYTQYYSNAQLKTRCTYKDNRINGKHESFYENGQIHSVSFIINGLKQGLHVSYAQNGQLTEKWWYKNNKIHGIAYLHMPFSKSVEKLVYDNGQFLGDVQLKNNTTGISEARFDKMIDAKQRKILNAQLKRLRQRGNKSGALFMAKIRHKRPHPAKGCYHHTSHKIREYTV